MAVTAVTAARIGIAVVMALVLVGAVQSRTASAAVAVPAFGSFYVDGSSVVAPGAQPPEDDPFHDIANDCNFNYPFYNPNFPDLVNYISILEDGTMTGECRYTDSYFNVTETMTAFFGGTVNVETGVFANLHVSSTLRFVVTGGETPTTTTYNITYDVASGTLSANGFAQGTANFTFGYTCSGGCGDVTSRGYSGTVTYLFSVKAANEADLSVEHIEVVQVVQDENNTIPLVAAKSTVARVYLHANSIVIGAKVKLSSGGEELNVATADALPGTPDREAGDSSANFLLPREWLDAGSIDLNAEVMPPDGWTDPNDSNNTASALAEFEDRGGLFVDYIKVCNQPGGVGPLDCPHGDVNSMHLFAQDIFPLADEALIYNRIVGPTWIYKGNLVTAEDENAFLAALRKRYDFSEPDADVVTSIADQIVAWLPPGLSIEGGAADARWGGGTGRVFYLQHVTGGQFELGLQVAFAHEIAHNLGRRHPQPGKGACNGAPDPASDWPYADIYTQEVGFWVRRQMVMGKGLTDLMAACDQPWISPHTYKKLFDGNFTAQGVTAQGTTTNFLIVSGNVLADGSGGSLDPAYQMESSAPPPVSTPGGNTCLEFTGGAASEFCFDLTFEGGEEGTALASETFAVKVALPSGTTRVALKFEGTELDSLQSSASNPAVEISAPSQGDEWTGEQTISWSGSDGDGGPLTYTVLYSPDGGERWIPLAVDVTDPEFTLDSAELAAGSNVLVRVLASDGLNTTEETVGPITVGTPVAWGDLDCDGELGSRDGQALLRKVLDQAALSQEEGCTPVGDEVRTPGRPIAWGDIDCDGEISSRDNQVLLRKVLSQPALTQTEPCPDPGEL